MLPLKKIICPVDFSEPSNEGLNAAIELAESFSAELIIVNVVHVQPVVSPGIPTSGSGKTYYDEINALARQSLDEIVQNRVPKGVNVRSKVLLGQPAYEIITETEAEKADIIVMATHGWTGWRRFIFGSVAEKVVRLSPVPVLTIPKPEEGGQ